MIAPLVALFLSAAPAPEASRTVPPEASAAAVRTGSRPAGSLRRFALIVGTNDGGPDRIRLRYATTDAQTFAQVLEELGGVPRQDARVLLDVNADKLRAALAEVSVRVADARANGERSELVLYYSGHSDEDGLRMIGQTLAYSDLRNLLKEVPADVRIAILDSCASGGLTRGKGGRVRPAFMSDASSQVSGHAFLTSSSADEASQESDRIGASFFTHFLVSGLRGAADLSRDGRVTLAEAYQFAFDETLARTQKTANGPQHPAFDLQLAGSGEVVMTDLRSTSGGMILPEQLAGRVFVRNEAGHLIAELNKFAGRPVELGLPPGAYQVSLEQPGRRATASLQVIDGQRAKLLPELLVAQAMEATAARGSAGSAQTLSPTPPETAPHAYQDVFFSVGLIPLPGDLLGNERKHLSLNLLGGGAAALSGLSASGVLDLVRDGVEGMQLSGTIAIAGGPVRGAQLSGLLNFSGDLLGAQIAGVGNWAKEVRVLQTAGLANIAQGTVQGAQLGGVLNVAGQLQGAQVSLLNVSGDVDGAQVGLINIAGVVRGTQVGLVNIAASMRGVPIGLISLFPEMEIHGQISASELFLANASLMLGTPDFYTYFAAGGWPTAQGLTGRWLFSVGVGWHALHGPLLLDLDLGAGSLHEGWDWQNDNGLFTLRVTAGWRIANHFSIIAGATGNAFFQNPNRPFEPPANARAVKLFGQEASVWPGVFAGLRF